MEHFKKNLEYALQASEDLLAAAKEQLWDDNFEQLLSLRDKAANEAFPQDMPEELHREAQRVFALLEQQQKEIMQLAESQKQSSQNELINQKRNNKSIQSYLSE